jgi:hypothetical protein
LPRRCRILAHAGCGILRLLHRQRDQVVLRGIDARSARRRVPGQVPRIDFDESLATLDRHPDAKHSRLMSSASAGRQTSFTVFPASINFTASNEPYDAPRIRTSCFDFIAPPVDASGD